MLSIKVLLAKILGRLNFRIVEVDATSATTISANGGTAWISVPVPSSGTAIAVVGYYLSGGYTCCTYSIALYATNSMFAVRNNGSGAQSVTITARYLVVD